MWALGWTVISREETAKPQHTDARGSWQNRTNQMQKISQTWGQSLSQTVAYTHQNPSSILTHKFAWKKCLSVQNELFHMSVQNNLSLVFMHSTSDRSHTGVRHTDKGNGYQAAEGASAMQRTAETTAPIWSSCGNLPSSRSGRSPAPLTPEEKEAGDYKQVWIGHCLTLLSCYKTHPHNYEITAQTSSLRSCPTTRLKHFQMPVSSPVG